MDTSPQSTTTPTPDRRGLGAVLLIAFVDSMGLTIIIPIMPYYATAFGASPAVIGVISATYAIGQVIFTPILGRLSDRVGRRRVLIIAQTGTVASLLLLGSAGTLWLIFLARLIDGITGANVSTVQSVVGDLVCWG
jgi:MFS transporter, DHA1 family, tetracycline resistance protein